MAIISIAPPLYPHPASLSSESLASYPRRQLGQPQGSDEEVEEWDSHCRCPARCGGSCGNAWDHQGLCKKEAKGEDVRLILIG